MKVEVLVSLGKASVFGSWQAKRFTLKRCKFTFVSAYIHTHIWRSRSLWEMEREVNKGSKKREGNQDTCSVVGELNFEKISRSSGRLRLLVGWDMCRTPGGYVFESLRSSNNNGVLAKRGRNKSPRN